MLELNPHCDGIKDEAFGEVIKSGGQSSHECISASQKDGGS